MKTKVIYFTCISLFIFSLFAAAALDLRFTTDITISPDPANMGDTVTFSVNWKNFGAAVDNMTIQGGIDGTTILNYTYPHLDSAVPQETKTFTWTATAGTHTVWFELDPAHTCGDSNYSNNRIEKTFVVAGPAGQPNLKIEVSFSPASFAAGDSVTFNLKVTNNGTIDSTACNMLFKKGGSVLQSFNIPVVPAGGQADETYIWTAECNATLSAEVDTNNANTESNESDNVWSKQMICAVVPPSFPDLVLGVTYLPATFNQGDEVTFNITVDNKGNAPSPITQVIYKDGQVWTKLQGVPPLEANGHWEISLKKTFMCGAILDIVVDDENKIAESNENNNKWHKKMNCGTFTMPRNFKKEIRSINATPKPDASDLWIKSFKWNKSVPPEYGASLEVEVENIGAGKSLECKMTSSTPDSFPDITMTIPELAAGSSHVFRYVQRFKCGTTLTIKVDSNNKNLELNEENNKLIKNMVCLGN